MVRGLALESNGYQIFFSFVIFNISNCLGGLGHNLRVIVLKQFTKHFSRFLVFSSELTYAPHRVNPGKLILLLTRAVLKTSSPFSPRATN